MKLIIQGETPSKKNSRIVNRKTGRTFPSKTYKAWHDTAIKSVGVQAHGLQPVDKPCLITVYFVHGDKRRRDSDNGLSSIMDLLVDAKVLTDDNWQIVKAISVHNDYEERNAHCTIFIESIEE